MSTTSLNSGDPLSGSVRDDDGHRKPQAAWHLDNHLIAALENILITITTETISTTPATAATSSFCPCRRQAIAAINTVPTPDQIAYATPVGIRASDKEKE